MYRTANRWWVVAGLAVVLLPAWAQARDWPYWRGPEQNGVTRENAVVKDWSLDGKNVLWKAPVGGRTTPIVMNDRVYAITPAGNGECLQERVICLNADTGKTVWEHRFNAFHTDIVENRLGWTSVVGDPETGNVYAHGTGGELFCFDRDGKVLWKWSLTEEFGRYSGYGGRLHTPIIDEDRVIISYVYILAQWATGKTKSGHRYMAMDKRTGEVLWWSQPGEKPLDTTYSVPVVTVVDGQRIMVAGNADGNVYGMNARTGERLWAFHLAKRGINSSIVVDGKYAYVCHSEENLDTTDMGRVVCIDVTGRDDVTKTHEVWRADGVAAGYSSPAISNGRLYVVTNSASLLCYDSKSGKQHWEHNLGRVMKGSPVVTSDGVIYTGEVNGIFSILQDAGDHCDSLNVVEFPMRDDAVVEMNGSPAVVDGRVYFMNTFETFCLGTKDAEVQQKPIPQMAAEAKPDANKPRTLQVIPAELVLAPGERAQFKLRLFDENGLPIGEPAAGDAKWSFGGVQGRLDAPGAFMAATDEAYSAGALRASLNGLAAESRVRVMPRPPIHETFNTMAVGEQPPGWIGVDLTTVVAEKDGEIVLQKLANSPSAPYCRTHAFSCPPIPIGFTVEADLMAEPREGRRPVISDMGLINNRYKMILLGYEKQLRLVAYDPIPRIQKDIPFDWQPSVWYRAKMRVDLDGDRSVMRCKVWPRGQAEPDEWTSELVDPCPSVEGSPGLYVYTKGVRPGKPGSLVYFDNYEVKPNE